MPTSYNKDLLDDLKNRPGYAARYLTAAAADSTEALLIALRDVGTAKKGMTGLAAAAEVNRVNLYHMLSRRGNPGIKNLRAILEALQLQIQVVDKHPELASTPVGAAQIREPLSDPANAPLPSSDLSKTFPGLNSAMATLAYSIVPPNVPQIGSRLGLGLSRRADTSKLGTVRYLLSSTIQPPAYFRINP
jgi:DNA-binding phage protein